MRMTFLTLLAIGVVTAQAAENGWTGPAWYHIAITFVGPFVMYGHGSFADQDSCRGSLPQSDRPDLAEYTCEFLAEKPADPPPYEEDEE